MANPEHLKILKQGVEGWNRWRKENRRVAPDLSGAYLSRLVNLGLAGLSEADLSLANLGEADFSGTNLDGASLRGAYLSEADLSLANLSEADLDGANLCGANLSRADLTRASLRGADLTATNLRGSVISGAHLRLANLSGADLTGAHLSSATFDAVDLSETKGLGSVNHHGPSTVGIDTIYRSGGKIPEVFLRGCGVPDNFIEYIGSLVGKPIEFYSCFISYSSKDQEFADRLYADLQNKNVRCWFAPNDIKGGKKTERQIDEAIRIYDKLLLILSRNSMNSEWVKTEIRKARKREVQEKRQMLFPVRLVSYVAIKRWECFDADSGKDLAVEIREYFVPDFSKWKEHDQYQESFQRLLGDLKRDAGTPGRLANNQRRCSFRSGVAR